jgi:protein-S-isoprenylcysteine O-methyltransferase Ste14
VGIILILFGTVLNVWSVAHLGKRNTTLGFHGMPTELVVDGPFRISRNPIYLSGVMLTFGVALLLGSLIVFGFLTAVSIVLNNWYIPAEEAILEQTFGETYRQYKRKVRRWI